MEPESFCEYCDSKSDGIVPCAVAEFYPKKGFCPVASIGGAAVQMDCSSVHIDEIIVPREKVFGLIGTILAGAH